jgi:hypothetical protein
VEPCGIVFVPIVQKVLQFISGRDNPKPDMLPVQQDRMIDRFSQLLLLQVLAVEMPVLIAPFFSPVTASRLDEEDQNDAVH